tara:strand:+ start:4219 stop:4494 length:276 start_codon:yes stop_codon:yes gene_type:complete
MMSNEIQPERRRLDNRIHEIAYLLMKLRIAQVACLVFICYLTFDFHTFYMANFDNFEQWQMVSVVAYMGGFLGALKLMFENIKLKVSKDDI